MLREQFERSVRGSLELCVGSRGHWFDQLVDLIVLSPDLDALLSHARADGEKAERERIVATIEADPGSHHGTQDALVYQTRVLGAAMNSAIGWIESGAEPMVAVAAMQKTLRENPVT